MAHVMNLNNAAEIEPEFIHHADKIGISTSRVVVFSFQHFPIFPGMKVKGFICKTSEIFQPNNPSH